ncbi:MAG: hypothetical protein PHY90_07915 [Desulfitobacteriaceae bacterium]|jgi:hypothetical protein|nr:hypothetical protein [Desulfitobacteriaceae bacterium]
MSTIIDKVMIDADFTMKLGKLKKYKIIENYLPQFADMIYIHEYIYKNEVLYPPLVKQQIDKLIQKGQAAVVNHKYILDEKPEAADVYVDTQDLLMKNIDESVEGHKNWGEIVSISFANAMGINYFLSDESKLQGILDEHVNVREDDGIRVFRITDFLLWMKEAGLERKIIRTAWIFYENQNDVNTEKDIERIKKWFDTEFWPV